MSNINGVNLKTEVSIDWADLAGHLAHESNHDQVNSLTGFASQLRALGGIDGEMQVAYIADHIKERERHEDYAGHAEEAKALRWFIDTLKAHLDG